MAPSSASSLSEVALIQEAQRKLATARPVAELDNAALAEECHFYTQCLTLVLAHDTLEGEPLAARHERHFRRWAGIAMAVAGIPICWATFEVGLAASIAGLCLTGWCELRGHQERSRDAEREHVAEPIVRRSEALVTELATRARGKN